MGLWITIAFIVGAIFGMGGTIWFFKRVVQRKAQKMMGKALTGNLDVDLANTEGGTEVIKGLMRMWKG